MIDVRVLPDADAVGVAAADLIDGVATRPGGSVLGLATGSSPDRVYGEIVRRHSGGPNPYRDARIFILDEYVGLADGHPERYAAVIRRAIADPLGIPADRVHAPDAEAHDLDEAGPRYDAAIEAAGGIDLQLLGVGSNGHIAFNEPGTPFDSLTHVTTLAEQTRRDNARFFGGNIDAVPRRAMTQGIGTILRARQLLLIAVGSAKTEAVAALLHREPTEEWPVTALHHHDSVTVLLDPAAAAGVDLDDVRPSIGLGRSSSLVE